MKLALGSRASSGSWQKEAEAERFGDEAFSARFTGLRL